MQYDIHTKAITHYVNILKTTQHQAHTALWWPKSVTTNDYEQTINGKQVEVINA